jgi:Flp pilus assembly secretin CpaC
MRFRISTLLWITLAIACFFAGMSWDDVRERLPRAVTTQKTAVVQVSKSITIGAPSKLMIPRVVVNDPTLVSATAISPTSIRLTGQAEGTTTASLWDANGVRTDYAVTVKPKFLVLHR